MANNTTQQIITYNRRNSVYKLSDFYSWATYKSSIYFTYQTINVSYAVYLHHGLNIHFITTFFMHIHSQDAKVLIINEEKEIKGLNCNITNKFTNTRIMKKCV